MQAGAHLRCQEQVCPPTCQSCVWRRSVCTACPICRPGSCFIYLSECLSGSARFFSFFFVGTPGWLQRVTVEEKLSKHAWVSVCCSTLVGSQAHHSFVLAAQDQAGVMAASSRETLCREAFTAVFCSLLMNGHSREQLHCFLQSDCGAMHLAAMHICSAQCSKQVSI